MRSLENICQGTISDYHETYRVVIPHTDKLYWEESYATIAKRDADGKPLSIVGTSMRIDDRKQMEEALVKARNRAEESDRLKSAFLANISHEIRTPLNAIVGFTGILNEIPEGDEHQMLMGLIQENSQKLLRIVDDVVNISKFEAGKDELSMSIFDLNMVLREQCDKYAPRLASGVKLSTDFAETQLSISSDRTRVADVIDHLLSNAVKFTQSGSIVVGFNEPVANRIRIWVRDTGKGIAPEHLDRIFERFFKVDEFIPGAGLGLSICRTMAYSLGGSVTCESKLGEGSTFWLDIPIQ
jgi:signal transduction histidine kinase